MPRESAEGERRVALVPDTAGRLASAGFDIAVERGAGAVAGWLDQAYLEAGATVVGPDDLLEGAACAHQARPKRMHWRPARW